MFILNGTVNSIKWMVEVLQITMSLVSGDNVLREVVLTWKVSCDLHFRWQVALANVKNDCQDIIVPGGVAPQGKGLLAGV